MNHKLHSTSVSVLMTVYNGSRFLGQAIESILGQTFSKFEFLIIDDCSTDNSIDIIKGYKDPRIRLKVNGSNLGQTKSLNLGLSICSGEYVARLDQDDFSFERRLEKQKNFLDRNGDIAVLGSWTYDVDDGNRKKGPVRKSPITHEDCAFSFFINSRLPIRHSNVMYRKKVVIDEGGYDEKYQIAQDSELWYRLLSRNYRFSNIPEALTAFRKTEYQLSFYKKDIGRAERGEIYSDFLNKVLKITRGNVQTSNMLSLLEPSNESARKEIETLVRTTSTFFDSYSVSTIHSIYLMSRLWQRFGLKGHNHMGKKLTTNTKTCFQMVRIIIPNNKVPSYVTFLIFYSYVSRIMLSDVFARFIRAVYRFRTARESLLSK